LLTDRQANNDDYFGGGNKTLTIQEAFSAATLVGRIGRRYGLFYSIYGDTKLLHKIAIRAYLHASLPFRRPTQLIRHWTSSAHSAQKWPAQCKGVNLSFTIRRTVFSRGEATWMPHCCSVNQWNYRSQCVFVGISGPLWQQSIHCCHKRPLMYTEGEMASHICGRNTIAIL